MELKDVLLRRRSVRKFTDEPVSEEHIQELLHAAMSGPSACNKQPWAFYVVTNPDMVEALRALGAKKVAVMTPYGEEENLAEKKFLEDRYDQKRSQELSEGRFQADLKGCFRKARWLLFPHKTSCLVSLEVCEEYAPFLLPRGAIQKRQKATRNSDAIPTYKKKPLRKYPRT